MKRIALILALLLAVPSDRRRAMLPILLLGAAPHSHSRSPWHDPRGKPVL